MLVIQCEKMNEKLTCEHCNKWFERKRGQTRSKNIFCSLQCSGASRRIEISKEEKVRLKKEYDKQYRAKNLAEIKKRKAVYFQKTYDPAKAAIHRKARMPAHLEYCRRPEYREWKKNYDERYHAKKNNGEFWESAIILNKIADHVDKYQAYLDKGTFNKSQKRKRLWKSSQRKI